MTIIFLEDSFYTILAVCVLAYCFHTCCIFVISPHLTLTKLALENIKVINLLNKTINDTNAKLYYTKYTMQKKSSNVLVRIALKELTPPNLFSIGISHVHYGKNVFPPWVWGLRFNHNIKCHIWHFSHYSDYRFLPCM